MAAARRTPKSELAVDDRNVEYEVLPAEEAPDGVTSQIVLVDGEPAGLCTLIDGTWRAFLTNEPSKDPFPRSIGRSRRFGEAVALVVGAWRMNG